MKITTSLKAALQTLDTSLSLHGFLVIKSMTELELNAFASPFWQVGEKSSRRRAFKLKDLEDPHSREMQTTVLSDLSTEDLLYRKALMSHSFTDPD